jgi:hypothetical protein
MKDRSLNAREAGMSRAVGSVHPPTNHIHITFGCYCFTVINRQQDATMRG